MSREAILCDVLCWKNDESRALAFLFDHMQLSLLLYSLLLSLSSRSLLPLSKCLTFIPFDLRIVAVQTALAITAKSVPSACNVFIIQ